MSGVGGQGSRQREEWVWAWAWHVLWSGRPVWPIRGGRGGAHKMDTEAGGLSRPVQLAGMMETFRICAGY